MSLTTSFRKAIVLTGGKPFPAKSDTSYQPGRQEMAPLVSDPLYTGQSDTETLARSVVDGGNVSQFAGTA